MRASGIDGQRARKILGTVDTSASYATLPVSLRRETGAALEGQR